MESKNRERNYKLQDELTNEIEGMKPDDLSDPILLSPKTGKNIMRINIQSIAKWVNLCLMISLHSPNISDPYLYYFRRKGFVWYQNQYGISS